MWFNRKARNRASAWWVQGFVQDQKLFRDQNIYIHNDKAQDYHDMLSTIVQEMKQIHDSGGIRLTLDFGLTKRYDAIAILVIQFIISDYKGNDLLCDRKSGYALNMNGSCRDCDIKPYDDDNICIDQELMCNFIKKYYIIGETEEQMEKYSLLSVRNVFHGLSFGGCSRNIYGGTPAENLHTIILGLCEHTLEVLEPTFTTSTIDMISDIVVGIYKDSSRQNERDVPDLGSFRNGLTPIKLMKAKEQFIRIFCIYLALSNSYLIEKLCAKKRKKDDKHKTTPLLTTDFLRGYLSMIEDTLTFIFG